MTLIEVLLALTIFTIVIGIGWAILSSSFKYTNKLSVQTELQQEAHTIINAINKIHLQSDEVSYIPLVYTITLDQNPKGNVLTISNTKTTFQFDNQNFYYSIIDFSGTPLDTNFSVNPINAFNIKVIVEDKNSNSSADLSTIISR